MLTRKFKSGLSLVLIAVLMTACSTKLLENPADALISSHHDAAEKMIHMAGKDLPAGSRMIAASFADINDLTSSSPFGRMASQQLVSSFSLKGYPFVEMLMRNSVYIDKREGEFLLSREVSDISAEHNAPIVLVGTYAVGSEFVFVTSKLIRTIDNVIIASHDYALPYTRDLRALTRSPVYDPQQ